MKFAAAVLGLAAVGGTYAWDTSAYTRTVHYDGQKIVSCPVSEKNAPIMQNIVETYGLNIWEEKPDGVELRLKPENLANRELMSFLGNCKVLVEDVEEAVVAMEKEFLEQQSQADEWFESYHTYSEIKGWYEDLADTYSNLATFTPSIGKTENNRDLFRLVFTGTSGGNKPSIYFQCQIHAREWISGATCGYVVNYLLENYGKVQNVTSILDSVEFHVVPIVNPDGYEYTWTNDRLWRKNRSRNEGSTCLGTDLNRNYNSHWASGGSSGVPCSDTYYGASANSEPETKTTIAAFQNAAPVIGAIDWHSYSQLILRPWGWTRTDSPDEAQLRQIGADMQAAIYSVHGTSFTNQKSIELYVTTGTASDWFYDDEATETNAGYRAAGYTFELRDQGRYGFELPPDQIIPSGEEMLAAVMTFVPALVAQPIHA